MRKTGTPSAAETPRVADADAPAEQPGPTCFVIQPFDRGKFDKRYEDAFEPALAEAGFSAYRVDEDPGTDVLITAIEQGIRSAAICLADVTKDNPNVWYELGYAYAAGKPVVLTCCDEREGPLPFDIRHRHVIHYQSESAIDFENLKLDIAQRASVLLERVAERQMDDADPIAPQDGLPQREVHLLGLAAAETPAPDARAAVWTLESKAESGGLTPVAFGLAFRGLTRRGFIEKVWIEDRDGDYAGAYVTDEGWGWIEAHDQLFNLESKPRVAVENVDSIDEDVPF